MRLVEGVLFAVGRPDIVGSLLDQSIILDGVALLTTNNNCGVKQEWWATTRGNFAGAIDIHYWPGEDTFSFTSAAFIPAASHRRANVL